MAMTTLSNRAQEAQSAMHALVQSRGLAMDEEDPLFPALVAKIAWLIADAMAAERIRRSREGR